MKPSPEDLKSVMRDMTAEELYILLRFHSGDYTPDALHAASEEFRERHLDERTMERLAAAGPHGMPVESVQKPPSDAKKIAPEDASLTWGSVESVQKPPSDAKKTAPQETSATWGCLVLLGLVGWAGYGIYGAINGWLDSIGWIAHPHSTMISVRSDWLVGESKDCWSATLDGDNAAVLGKTVGYAMSTVSCDDGPEHKMYVTFYGREVQTEYRIVDWSCTRNSNSLTCYQKGGHR